MTKIEVLIQSPDVSLDTPSAGVAAKSKILYRAGDLYCRMEEQADPEHGIHGLMIIHEPDAWMVNLATKTALHLVDAGSTERCRMPIFADRLRDMPADEQKQIGDLEFGREVEFFTSRGAKPRPGPILRGEKTAMYELRFGASGLALFTYGDPDLPLAVVWRRGQTHEIVWYTSYTTPPFDPSLFAEPGGVIITEVKPKSGAAK
ncbi:MAG: hypothetical protein WBD67_03640 [Terracidiphilus sp.]